MTRDDEKEAAVQATAEALVENGAMAAFIFTVWIGEDDEPKIGVGCVVEKREMLKTLAHSLHSYARDLEAGTVDVTVNSSRPVGKA